ncbi:hypothetical protein Bca52824_002939 [Brassica carinata]|uniref:Uncharacterized protein n=1 Tax=Brassica carinata TaxID=52824 RepID=A0A8X7WL49_BRACI|nr:hypothetical protein Bca52824_002939 [Brassica carinata]
MITPRVMYGSASHGNTAFFAGGIQMEDNGNPVVMRTVENANTCFGWGVAFKSMGDRLLVVGTSHSGHGKTMVCQCRPSPDVEEQHWEELKHWCDGAELPQFIHNCCVMFA